MAFFPFVVYQTIKTKQPHKVAGHSPMGEGIADKQATANFTAAVG
jgi:hypothetical protein